MAKKTRLGLGLFFNNTTNSGIVNYIYNIVAALHTLPLNSQPAIVLIHNADAEISQIKAIGYADINFIMVSSSPKGLVIRKMNNLVKRLTGYNLFLKMTIFNKIDCFYPFFLFLNGDLSDAPNKIEWLVDFNNRSFPQHYQDNGKAMREYQEELTSRNTRIILSSYTLLDELKLYYPNYKNDVKILRFACSLPSLQGLDARIVKSKHKIEGVYFMSPNQFWEHKNQIVVLKAIQEIKLQFPNLKFKVLFTGSLDVNRGKGLYAETLQKAIEDFGITSYVQFLGVLDRREQLLLMEHSLALLQPSLYEGWSTLVEEAKALNKFIILSDLPVHREQISDNVVFFNPNDSEELASKMIIQLQQPFTISYIDYKITIQKYGEKILDAIQF